MFSPMPAASVQTDALEERIQQPVGARVRELRQAAGITAVILAERTGISQGQLSKIENSKAALSVKILARGGYECSRRPVGRRTARF